MTRSAARFRFRSSVADSDGLVAGRQLDPTSCRGIANDGAGDEMVTGVREEEALISSRKGTVGDRATFSWR